eukprot:TRINITY_DN18675_c0_g1_i1.p1 TRINITY_DN18675_c0_g1~~TRINITY_DN18675_c0_g1_i1.p1  ORF type:complete len:170 (+),score=23.35 TRINITY_DN18675_c0_g1_i1:109-618(+)
MSLATAGASLAWKDTIAKENRLRRSYWVSRFGSGALPTKGERGIFDPWNNDEVSPLNGTHRVLAIPEISGSKSWTMFKHTGRAETPPREHLAETFKPWVLSWTQAPTGSMGRRAKSASSPQLALASASDCEVEAADLTLPRTSSALSRASASVRSRRSSCSQASLCAMS